MAGLSSFLGFTMYKARVKISNLSSQIEQLKTSHDLRERIQITQTFLAQDQEKLLLKITVRNHSEQQPDKICVLSITSTSQYYLDGKLRNSNAQQDQKYCALKNDSNVPNSQKEGNWQLTKDGNWQLTKSFDTSQPRTIRVEKIYEDNSNLNSFINFNIGKSD